MVWLKLTGCSFVTFVVARLLSGSERIPATKSNDKIKLNGFRFKWRADSRLFSLMRIIF